MKNKKTKAIEIISALFIMLFVYAAVSKLKDYPRFVGQIEDSPFLTYDQAEILAWAVPGVELIIAALLAVPLLRRVGLYASSVLMGIFSVYIAAGLLLGEDLPCSCGGILEGMSWTTHLIFNIGFVALGLVGIFLHATPKPGSSSSASATTSGQKDYKEPAAA